MHSDRTPSADHRVGAVIAGLSAMKTYFSNSLCAIDSMILCFQIVYYVFNFWDQLSLMILF